ncbi:MULTISPECIES: hypothetical protein [Roseobacteraceae]|uniref:Glycerol-3-phosphate dehydrogenase n=1 Tax=Pseudosulfitobacter pseudonitzschiae TaxID=1402135 RepID=A0A221K1Q2_9RHOB|nr:MULTISPECIES: hypothetical protein [Roseobacteraceae]ASM72914.1 glycerol-3-phosphate dehydrogenase [Pseudosulfitobacter pseudonitzschiae]
MPDAVTNAEVEDVLSSIRRLVSEDRRVPAADTPKASTDRLVLTPALRVAEMPKQETVPAVEDAAAEDRFAADRAAETELRGEGAEDADADAVLGALLAEAQDDYDDQDNYDERDDGARYDARDADDSNDVDGDHVAPHSESGHDASAADAGVEAGTEGRSLHEVFRAVDAQEADEARKAAVLPHVPEYRDPSIKEPVAPQSLSAKIAVLEEVIARTDDQWEPDGAGRDDYAGTEQPAMAWEDASDDSEDDTGEAPEATIFAGQAPRTDTSDDVLSSDEDVLDEAALRDLVSDIVRQELQGALGERITRNVRKLVRREIHRALAAQDLE